MSSLKSAKKAFAMSFKQFKEMNFFLVQNFLSSNHFSGHFQTYIQAFYFKNFYIIVCHEFPDKFI